MNTITKLNREIIMEYPQYKGFDGLGVDIEESKNRETPNENMVRVYITAWRQHGESSFAFQIRTHKPTTRGGKPRDMIATASLTINEMEVILEHMKAIENREV